MEKVWNRVRSIDRLFLFSVVVPTLLGIVYFLFLASNVYVSESRFIVRSPDKPSFTGVGMLLKGAAGAGLTGGSEEAFAAQDYLGSRDALRALNKGGAFEKAYSRPSISFVDRFNPMGRFGSFERLYSYFQNKVKSQHDSTSSIITLTVRAYDPRDAQRFNEQLLEMAEATVNRLNDRARNDQIRVYQNEVETDKKQSEEAALALSAFRNREGVVDPEKQATVQIQMISKLQDELIATRAQLAQVKAVAPGNAQVQVLQVQAQSLADDIDAELGKVAGNRKSLSSTAAQYQRLQLENQFADRQLAAAMTALQDAENDQRRKQAYVERIVEPNLPDYSIEPRPIRGIFSILLFALIVWGVLSMMIAGVREHNQ